MFLFRIIGAFMESIAFPFILIAYAFDPKSYQNPSDILYRGDKHFSEVPGYCEVLQDTVGDKELTTKECFECCRELEYQLVRGIEYAMWEEAH